MENLYHIPSCKFTQSLPDGVGRLVSEMVISENKSRSIYMVIYLWVSVQSSSGLYPDLMMVLNILSTDCVVHPEMKMIVLTWQQWS